jgi:hypothetical protein
MIVREESIRRNFRDSIIRFVDACQIEDSKYAFASTPVGPETLYASCFATMIFHYLGRLQDFELDGCKEWAKYITAYQDEKTGLFIGPEIVPEELNNRKHDWEHVTMHLTAHVLPALHLLGGRPTYPLSFAQRFVDISYLQSWLDARDWKEAWWEGNNLLFIGQFLIFLRDFEGITRAQDAINLYFDWLDQQVDPQTGLWGSNGYCSNFKAMCGGYHQLLVYYFEQRPVRYPERLVDTVLALQHWDGGFCPTGGGGACEDVDAIDILVNMYKQANYRRSEIRQALRRALRSILQKQMRDGGFVYRLNQDFVHMGIRRTRSAANVSNMFSTWFRIHTLALISEVLIDEAIAQFNWQFNDTCSMGWHRKWDKMQHQLSAAERMIDLLCNKKHQMTLLSKACYKKLKRAASRVRKAKDK